MRNRTQKRIFHSPFETLMYLARQNYVWSCIPAARRCAKDALEQAANEAEREIAQALLDELKGQRS